MSTESSAAEISAQAQLYTAESSVDWRGTARYAAIIPAAILMIRGADGALTFVRQKGGPFTGKWMLPGGGIEVGESAREAAVREAWEETGIVVSPRAVRMVGTYEIMATWPAGVSYHVLLSAFLAEDRHALPVGFAGDNGGGSTQVPADRIPLHSTDRRILTDAGLVPDRPAALQDALATDQLKISPLR